MRLELSSWAGLREVSFTPTYKSVITASLSKTSELKPKLKMKLYTIVSKEPQKILQ